jgi:hypothetical protein
MRTVCRGYTTLWSLEKNPEGFIIVDGRSSGLSCSDKRGSVVFGAMRAEAIVRCNVWSVFLGACGCRLPVETDGFGEGLGKEGRLGRDG